MGNNLKTFDFNRFKIVVKEEIGPNFEIKTCYFINWKMAVIKIIDKNLIMPFKECYCIKIITTKIVWVTVKVFKKTNFSILAEEEKKPSDPIKF